MDSLVINSDDVKMLGVHGIGMQVAPHGKWCKCPPGRYIGLGCPNPGIPLGIIRGKIVEIKK